MYRKSIAVFAAIGMGLCVTASLQGAIVTISTADGQGADSEIRQFDKDNDPGQNPETDVNFGNAESMNVRSSTTRGFNAAYVRFDVSGYVSGAFSGPVTFGITKWRDDEINILTVSGLDESVDAWIEGDGGADNSPAGELDYDNAPGILQDSDPLDGSDVDAALLTDLGTIDPTGDEGDVLTLSNANLLAFLNADTDGLVTFVIHGPTTSEKGVDAFATKETTALRSGATIPLGSGAPTLTFDGVPVPEPTSLALLAIGGLVGLRRRRSA